ncbi:DUF7669 domain-containing protein [Paenibacillus sp. RU26A]|uniref:DUF7669 domain-containing protein n=1 Tax=Paenibacillus sp. RU26A TaxID=1907393 RepID=UPI0009A6C46D|nr:hypothetical protein SAMN06272722_110102 [Paenibacillus sp. RU5A]SOC74260.1 hypothetical protein SAMN05880581_110102 [Paenibacillus sp. RU26A]SOC76410.1 hypothetical protein SAMN05880586_110102 [Paenibacillus sp. RU5M]
MGELNCREEILWATREIDSAKGNNLFTPKEVIDYMKKANTLFVESTIRTHITTRCCSNATHHHKSYYEDYERVQPGYYKVLNL